jgi:NAD(P)-dependent dehydrogenase (short-subunit alcohol dehydrogenase family)
MLARGEVGLAAAAAEVTVAGATPMVVPVDVADPFQIEAAVARIEDELGPIGIEACWAGQSRSQLRYHHPRYAPGSCARNSVTIWARRSRISSAALV